MKCFHDDIEELTLENTYFRKVLFTTEKSQLVLMSLRPGEDIGMEHHPVDQFFRFEAGKGEACINGKFYPVTDGSALVIPAGAEHNIINTHKTMPLKMYTVYSPAHHPAGTVHKTKVDAIKQGD